MYEVHASIHIDCSLERTFAAVSDHERFLSMGPITCVLLQEGESDRNGLGAIRKIDAGRAVFTEAITVFDSPRRFEYLISEVLGKNGKPLLIKHERGWVEFTAEAGGTRVDWRSRFRMTLPLVGWVAERFAGPGTRKSFDSFLVQAKARLEATK